MAHEILEKSTLSLFLFSNWIEIDIVRENNTGTLGELIKVFLKCFLAEGLGFDGHVVQSQSSGGSNTTSTVYPIDSPGSLTADQQHA